MVDAIYGTDFMKWNIDEILCREQTVKFSHGTVKITGQVSSRPKIDLNNYKMEKPDSAKSSTPCTTKIKIHGEEKLDILRNNKSAGSTMNKIKLEKAATFAPTSQTRVMATTEISWSVVV